MKYYYNNNQITLYKTGINFKQNELIISDLKIDGFLKITYGYNLCIYDWSLKVTNDIVQEEFYFPLFEFSPNKKVFIIAVYEKDANCKNGMLFFIKNGIKSDIDYLFVISGTITFESDIPTGPNISIIKRVNLGYDFGAYSLGIQLLKHLTYDYYFFMNSSTTGPFVPSYINYTFDEIFISKLRDGVHLVSPTIIIVGPKCGYIKQSILPNKNKELYPVCQTFMFVLDAIGLDILSRNNFFDLYYESRMINVILEKEAMLSCILLENGSNIACLLPEFKDVNFDDQSQVALLHKFTYECGHNPIEPNKLFGRSMYPTEVIFHKNNRNLNTQSVNSLMRSKSINDSIISRSIF